MIYYGVNVHKGSDKNITIGTMCPKCFRKKMFNVDVSINSNLSKRKFGLTLVPYYECPKCGEIAVAIDIDIIDDIAKLNKMGYRTEYCCSGHKSDVDCFYIFFKNKNIVRDIERYNIPLPEIFYFDEENKKRGQTVLRTKRLSNNLNKYEEIHTMVLSECHNLVNKLSAAKRKYGKEKKSTNPYI